jgi:hypothetical protein
MPRTQTLAFEYAAHPDVGALLIFRYADPLAGQVLGLVDAPVQTDIDRCVPERARQKHRYPDVVRVAAGHGHAVAGHRKLGDVEIFVPKRPEKHFLG